jgi:hypothetical protein
MKRAHFWACNGLAVLVALQVGLTTWNRSWGVAAFLICMFVIAVADGIVASRDK